MYRSPVFHYITASRHRRPPDSRLRKTTLPYLEPAASNRPKTDNCEGRELSETARNMLHDDSNMHNAPGRCTMEVRGRIRPVVKEQQDGKMAAGPVVDRFVMCRPGRSPTSGGKSVSLKTLITSLTT
ncbi:hypothetical protein BaRGS_00037738 [Batillaria attramentaria]|uniref:Uncharacterized protein n=1 Tax=Batillaria attramentaria TaxID=370345 RepID=A0ABD0J7W4_9CAEN